MIKSNKAGAAFRHQRDRVMPAAGSAPTTRNGADSVIWLNLDEATCDQIMHEGGCAAYAQTRTGAAGCAIPGHHLSNDCGRLSGEGAIIKGEAGPIAQTDVRSSE